MSQATLDVLNCYWSVIVFFAICVPRQLIAHVNLNHHRGKETRYLPRIHLFFANYSYSHKHSKRRSTIDISIYINVYIYICTGLHNLCHPTIRDGSTWSKFGARGEHGDVFLFSNLGALWFTENLIRYALVSTWSSVRSRGSTSSEKCTPGPIPFHGRTPQLIFLFPLILTL